MPVTSVSASTEAFIEMKKQCISASKVFQLGFETLKAGGLQALSDVNRLKAELESTKETLEMKELAKMEAYAKIAQMETQRSRLVDVLMAKGLTLDECKKIYMGVE